MLENYNKALALSLSRCIIQLSELLENYNLARDSSAVRQIIQLSELLENYNDADHLWFRLSIIQLSELLENYNLKILTDLYSSKISSHGKFPVSRMSVGFWIGRCGMW